jgi:periplasmic divalent cation tolerance protein
MHGMKEPAGEGERTLALVLTTEASRERAEALALTLLQQRLVACVSLLPVQSHYRWQGGLERAEEVQLLLKTSPELLNDLRAALATLHSYQTPEWIHWQATTAGAYGAWCEEQLGRG